MAKLFSIKQKYTDKIYENKKLLELRRQNVNIAKGETCFIYTSSPVKKITGYFVVKHKLRLPISELWEKTKNDAGLTKKEFLDYFKGCIEGTAIFFKESKKFLEGLALNILRETIKDFRPPQSYYNLNSNLYSIISKQLQQRQYEDIPQLS